MIPVQRPYLGPEELQAVGRVFDTRWLGLGSATKEFEDRLKSFLDAKHVIAVNTGTSAIHLALDALGVGAGDEVIVPSMTFVASVQAIIATGATPVFCDIEPDTFNMDVQDAGRRITSLTKVIMPVHYGGLSCDMDAIRDLASARHIRVVDDAAHAFGSSYRGVPIGTLADITCFSFDPIKNITTGEGGAVATGDDGLANQMMQKRILGISNDTWSRYRNERNWFYEVTTQGYRYHMSNINAAIGLAQLDRVPEFKARKQAIVRRYDEAFGGVEGLELLRHHHDTTFPFFYVLRVMNGRRDALMKYLKSHDIGSGVHWIPNHLQPLFAGSGASLPVTEQVYEEMLTLPLYYEMTDADIETVIEKTLAFLVTRAN